MGQEADHLSTPERVHENDTNLSRQACAGAGSERSVGTASKDVPQDATSTLSFPTISVQQPSTLTTAETSMPPPTALNANQIVTQGMQFLATAPPEVLGGVLVSLCSPRESRVVFYPELWLTVGDFRPRQYWCHT